VALQTVFVKLFQPFLTTFIASLHSTAGKTIGTADRDGIGIFDFSKAFEGWDEVFNKLLRGFEEKATQVCITPMTSVYCLHDTP
jgi:signal recognition particle receptor subunit alpha